MNITTTNGHIAGSFYTDSSLTLSTTNGDIRAIIEAYNEREKVPTNVSLTTTNA